MCNRIKYTMPILFGSLFAIRIIGLQGVQYFSKVFNIGDTEGYIRWLCAAFTSAAITVGIEHDLS